MWVPNITPATAYLLGLLLLLPVYSASSCYCRPTRPPPATAYSASTSPPLFSDGSGQQHQRRRPSILAVLGKEVLYRPGGGGGRQAQAPAPSPTAHAAEEAAASSR